MSSSFQNYFKVLFCALECEAAYKGPAVGILVVLSCFGILVDTGFLSYLQSCPLLALFKTLFSQVPQVLHLIHCDIFDSVDEVFLEIGSICWQLY